MDKYKDDLAKYEEARNVIFNILRTWDYGKKEMKTHLSYRNF